MLVGQENRRIHFFEKALERTTETLFTFIVNPQVMAECPRCGKHSKYVEKEWRHDAYDAKTIYCAECGTTFNAYYKDNKLSHTRPRKPQPASL